MRYITFAILIIVSLSAQSAWHNFWPNINQVQMINQSSGFAAGNNGLLLIYSGTQWDTISTGMQEDFTTISFLSQTDGWLGTAQGNIYHYNGTNFQMIYSVASIPALSEYSSILKIAFYNSQAGYAIVNDAYNWNGSGDTTKILKYNNGTWSVDFLPGGGLLDLAIRDSSDIWTLAINSPTSCYRNTGSGWQPYNFGFNIGANAKIFFNNGYGFLTSSLGTYFFNGSVWLSLGGNAGSEIWGTDISNIWVVANKYTMPTPGFGGRISHYNGSTWSNYSYPRSSFAGLNSIYFSDPNNGWAVGDEKNIIRIENDSIIPYYTRVPSLDSAYFNAVHCNSDTDTWAVGLKGCIFHYNGVDWHQVISPTTNNLNSVWFSAFNSGWAVGNAGTILKYDGNNWHNYSSPSASNLHSVNFSDAQNGWIAGDSGVFKLDSGNWVLKYSIPSHVIWTCNENFTWFGSIADSKLYQIYYGALYNIPFTGSGTVSPIMGICFVDSTDGFVAGSGYFLRYTESTGWQGIGGGASIFSCTDNNDCWSPSSEQVSYYSNGLWTSQSILQLQFQIPSLSGISMLNNSLGWVIGYGALPGEISPSGTQIYYTQDGGQPLSLPTAIKELNTQGKNYEKVSIFPNPSNKEIEVTGLSGGEPTTIEIFDIRGQVVFKTVTQTNNLIINISSLGSSIYIIETKNSTGISSQKLIVQH